MISNSKHTGRKVITAGTIVLGAVLLVVMTTAMGLQERRDRPQERQERPQEANITRGKVVSADATEVVVESDADGKVFVFRVLNRWRADGTRGLDEDVSAVTAALKEGESVVVNWGYSGEGEFHFIRTIATGENTFAFMHDRNIVTGWVVGLTDRMLTIETIEKGSRVELLVPRQPGEREERPQTERQMWEREIAQRAARLQIGQLVLVSYRSDEQTDRMWVSNAKAISF